MAKKYYQEFDGPIKLEDKNFQKIIDFYLFNCPVEGKSVRGKKFKDYGFSKSAPFKALKKAMLSVASASLSKNYLPSRKNELPQAFESVEAASPPDEYCVFLINEESGVLASLFSSIRNAFAHGSFNVRSYNGVRIFFLLNYNVYQKARLVLQEDTLLSWIRIVKKGYESLRS